MAAVNVGRPFPSVLLGNDARQITLADLAKNNPVVLVAPPRALATPDCASLSRAHEQLARQRIKLLVAAAAIPECASPTGILVAFKSEADRKDRYRSDRIAPGLWLRAFLQPGKAARLRQVFV
jgi:hypothetical protein